MFSISLPQSLFRIHPDNSERTRELTVNLRNCNYYPIWVILPVFLTYYQLVKSRNRRISSKLKTGLVWINLHQKIQLTSALFATLVCRQHKLALTCLTKQPRQKICNRFKKQCYSQWSTTGTKANALPQYWKGTAKETKTLGLVSRSKLC